MLLVHNVCMQAARRLMRAPEEVPSAGLASLVEATARLGNTSGVQKLLAMMREVGEAPTQPFYEALLKLANTRFYWDLALALLNEAEDDAVPVTAAMLGATLYSCLQADVRTSLSLSIVCVPCLNPVRHSLLTHALPPDVLVPSPQRAAAPRGGEPPQALREAWGQAQPALPHGAHPPPQ